MRMNWGLLKQAIKSENKNGNDYLFLLNDKGIILQANARMKKELNLRDPRQSRTNFFELLPAGEREAVRNAWLYSMKSKHSYRQVALHKGRGVTMQWQMNYLPALSGIQDQFICRGNYIQGEHTMIKPFVAHHSNEDLESKLRIAEEKLEQLSRMTTDAIWEWDMLAGTMTRNPKLSELTGYPHEDKNGLSWWLGLVHPEDRDRLANLLRDVTDKGLKSWQCEYRFLCADGEYRDMLDHGYVISENNLPVKMIGSLHDITGEKLMQNLLMEERLRQYRIISENTVKVQEAERSRFGRELHDNVNQVLSTIRLYLGMLTPHNQEDEEIKEKTMAYTLLAIEEIRKLSREMITPKLQPGQLAENIHVITRDVEKTMGIKMEFTHDDIINALSPAKSLALYRIIQEQVKNIVKYSQATRAEIRLQSSQEKVLLSIKDNGMGFDIKKTMRGVGLCSMEERTKFYNGEISIESAEQRGTSVTVSMPVRDSNYSTI